MALTSTECVLKHKMNHSWVSAMNFRPKYWREIRHGYRYAIRTYNRGTFYEPKYCTLRHVNGLN